MATTALDLNAINALLADTRTRGQYEKDVRAFFESGDLAVDFTEKYPGKDAASLRNSVNQNAKKVQAENTVNGKHTPAWQVVFTGSEDKKCCVLINMDTYRDLKQGSDSE